MLNTILVSLLVTVVSSLVTYFITSTTYTHTFKNQILECIRIHEKIFHQKELDTYVAQRIKDHVETCPFGNVQTRIVKMLEFMVKQKGADPSVL